MLWVATPWGCWPPCRCVQACACASPHPTAQRTSALCRTCAVPRRAWRRARTHSTRRSAITDKHACLVVRRTTQAELSGGRLWEGKEALLKAVAALVGADPRVVTQQHGEGGAADGGRGVVATLMAAAARKKVGRTRRAGRPEETALRFGCKAGWS